MEILLPWGRESMQVDLPDSWQIQMPEQEMASADSQYRDEVNIVKEAMDYPVGAQGLSSRDMRGKNVLIIVDDNTRPTPVHRFLHLVLQGLYEAGADKEKISLVTALGIHTPMTEAEMEEKIGRENLEKVDWSNHDAFNPENNTCLGTTSLGTPVELNREVQESDFIVLLGMTEPHLWAGFGGGLKNIFPGVASARAIGVHHGMIAQPPYQFNRVGLLPQENSFRRDLEEIKGFIPAEIFCVNVTLDAQNRIESAFAGDPLQSQRRGAEHCIQYSGVRVDRPVDAVVVNSHPMDINFKQSMKCVANALPALKPGGTVMVFLRAERGLDDIPLPDKPPPLPVLKSILRVVGKSNVLRFLNLVKKDLNVEEKFLNYYSLRLIREYHLFFHVPALTREESRHLGFFHRCETPGSVIDRGANKLKKDARVLVLPNGGSTFPVLSART
ncbi:MAG: nickel-dependent lactate racemase [Thermodesulfobacteriota bacterium]